MNEKLTFTGGEPNLNWDDLDRNNEANRLALFAIMKAFNIGTNENFIISGCVATLDPGVDVAVIAGYIFLNEEVVQVEAQTVLNGGTADLYTYNKAVTYDANGTKTFNDTNSRETWRKNRGIVTASTTPILVTELDVINGDRLHDKIVQQIATNSTEKFAAANIPIATESDVGGLETATTAEAEGVALNDKIMTPIRTSEAVKAMFSNWVAIAFDGGDFTGWTGSGTGFSSRYLLIGKTVHFSMKVTGTPSGSTDSLLYDLPTAISNTLPNGTALNVLMLLGGVYLSISGAHVLNGDVVIEDNANFTAAAHTFEISGTWEIN